ncbi:uncharacterized protein SAPINGB_P000323 [Magnusiomyces paraingens]|uniref:Translation machinery-associated protein 16 n=1 Tax=Magnusiomyces paraingens TaxID=2606893 RepID=A0A5E8AZG2_9ASCO|nr:uncharacterized protein SAPINGB_P000323 [Saprochaete ingens]VVT44158.1 unnamed protein product [Saprochaete ingens]
MPVAKSLKKVAKKVKGSDKSLHPNGRKFKQLNRATLREGKLAKQKSERSSQRDQKILRYKHFQDTLKTSGKQTLSDDELRAAVLAFIARDNTTLDEYKAARRPGRPASSAQDALEQRIKREQQELKSGFVAPDLTDKANAEMFAAWNGTAGGLSTIKKVRVTEDNVIRNVKDVEMEDD